MAYTINEKTPRIRALAVRMVRSGKSTRETARYFGYNQSSISRWCKKAGNDYVESIETIRSTPKRSPNALSEKIIGHIIRTRIESGRCAEVVHEILKQEETKVSLSSVKRVISRYGLLKKRSPWKRKRVYPPRPDAKKAGILVQMDTIHFVDKNNKRTYVYTVLDVYSRYGYAVLSQKANCYQSIKFLKKVINYFPFRIHTIQTDNGPEFGLYFTDFVTRHKITHRHIHPRSPNENGHLERFNRTIQEEIIRYGWCILVQKDIDKFINYYNTKRLHMGIGFKTPIQLILILNSPLLAAG